MEPPAGVARPEHLARPPAAPLRVARCRLRIAGWSLLLAAIVMTPAAAAAATEVTQPQPVPGTEPVAPAPGSDAWQLEEVVVVAPEPRFVAPTRRDQIGRIWAPVEINGRGPFRFVLDTGATRSALTAGVAAQLGLPMHQHGPTLLRGVTGTATVATVPIQSLAIGELMIEPRTLPIVPDALGGAEGVLGTEGLFDKRILIDFRNDRITIRRSHAEPAPYGFVTVPVEFLRGHLIVVAARMGDVAVKAIIDTGGQATIGNLALRDALLRWRRRERPMNDEITGATDDVQSAERYMMPPIALGGVEVRRGALSFGDMVIFDYWKLVREPAMLVGMDVLGVLDTLIIDYQRRELQVRVRGH